jgi:iron-sulfur cluster repair protein YtfE (RIC family)
MSEPIETASADIHAEMTVNEIIRMKPATVAVFQRLGIDACCGGALSLAEVAKRHRFDFIALLTELELA